MVENTTNEQKMDSKPCPNCGYCPHCGRSGYGFVPQYPWWYQPYYTPIITWTSHSDLIYKQDSDV